MRSVHITFLPVVFYVAAAYDGGISYLKSAFPEVDGDLTKITWAHAVNSQEKLDSALKSNVHMIEADISYGHLIGDEAGQLKPIMAHPPSTISDLSLEEFLQRTLSSETKGVKLDFKSREALTNSVPIMNNATLYANMALPFMLNADILQGPINCNVTPVDADYFLSTASKYPQAILSLGWTTCYGPQNKHGKYTQENVENMTHVLLKNNVISEVTFPVRAGLAAQSIDVVSSLVNAAADASLTIWSSNPTDPVDVHALKKLIETVGTDKVLLDLTPNLQKKLDSLSWASALRPHHIIILAPLLVISFYLRN